MPQRTFSRYAERTAFERPLTSGVAYAVRVLHSERDQFEKQQGWTIKRMDTIKQKPVQKDDYDPEALEPSPVQEEYAPVIFAQDTVSHVASLDMLSGKVNSSLFPKIAFVRGITYFLQLLIYSVDITVCFKPFIYAY